MAAEPIPHELLLRHAGFLRQLARDLVGDPAAADDAVQDVWLRALEKPPRHGSNVRGWLRVVLTNLVRTRARDDSRRNAREFDHGAVRELAPGSEQQSVLRSVTDAVLALDEPLRTTVLQHYFQGLTTAEIATRDNLAISTVKSRLQRALEILRARMKRENGDAWSHALIGLVVPVAVAHSAAIAGVGKGVIAMTTKSKLAMCAAALLAAWFLIHELTGLRGGPSEPAASSGASASLGALNEPTPPANSSLQVDSRSSERAASTGAADAQAAADAGEAPDTLLMGSLLDPAGKPIRDARAAWCSITASNGLRQNCDASQGGTYVFSHVPFGTYWVTAYAMGFRMAHEVVEIRTSEPHMRKDVTLTRQPLLRIRVTTPEGAGLRDVLRRDHSSATGIQLVPVATRERPGPMFDEVVGSLNNPFGIGHFWQSGPFSEKLPPDCMGFVLLDEDPPVYVSLLNWHAVLQTKEVHTGDEEVHFVLRPEDVLASVASIRVQVLDADGQTPLAGARAALTAQGEEEAEGLTGPDGIANLEHVVPCDGELVIGAKDHARTTLHVRALPGVVTDLGQVVLEQGITLQARVVDPAGEPTATNFELLRFDRASGAYRGENSWSLSSNAEGVLSIPSLGRELYLLRTSNLDAFNDQNRDGVKLVSANVAVDLRSGNAPNALEVRLVQATLLTLLLRNETNDKLRFRVRDAQGLVVVSDRFWLLTPHPLALPPGTYSVELLTPERVVLTTKSVTLGSTPQTLELSR